MNDKKKIKKLKRLVKYLTNRISSTAAVLDMWRENAEIWQKHYYQLIDSYNKVSENNGKLIDLLAKLTAKNNETNNKTTA